MRDIVPWHKQLCLATLLFSLCVGFGVNGPRLNEAQGTEFDRCPGWVGAHTELGFGSSKSIVLNATKRKDRINEKDIQNPVTYLRIRLRINNPGSGLWRVRLRDEFLRTLQIVKRDDFPGSASNGTGKHLWSARLSTDFLWIEFETEAAGEPAEIAVDGLIVMPEKSKVRYYSIKGDTPDWKDLHSPEANALPNISALRRAAQSVGLLMGRRDRQTWCCSGVVVATEPEILFLTNFHCGGPNITTLGQNLDPAFYWTDTICDNTIVDLSWDGDQVSNEFECLRVVHKDVNLDLAVISLGSLQNNPHPDRVRLEDADIAGQITIVHHPECLPKKVSYDCSVISARKQSDDPAVVSPDFTHQCDSEGGSSGAPAFNQSGKFLGLHHLGYEIDPNSGNCDEENKAVRVDEIIANLRGNDNLKGID